MEVADDRPSGPWRLRRSIAAEGTPWVPRDGGGGGVQKADLLGLAQAVALERMVSPHNPSLHSPSYVCAHTLIGEGPGFWWAWPGSLTPPRTPHTHPTLHRDQK